MKRDHSEEIMKSNKSNGLYRPFEDLKDLLDSKSLADGKLPERKITPAQPKTSPPKAKAEANKKTDPTADASMFKEAMAGVKRMSRDNYVEKNGETCFPPEPDVDDEEEVLMQLQDLVDSGKGFVVANTPEYIEGVGDRTHPEIAQRLHRGDFSIQGHLDLHGLTVEAAQTAFDSFLKESILSGKTSVLIIHGRGLSSPAEPVLKTNVYNWLSHGPWRRWVIAFTSARACDGGAGASYVLLRRQPLAKKYRKKKN